MDWNVDLIFRNICKAKLTINKPARKFVGKAKTGKTAPGLRLIPITLADHFSY